jgi:hypothetical protein
MTLSEQHTRSYTLQEQTPLYLRTIVEHEETERQEAALVLLAKLWQTHREGQSVDEQYLRTIERNVEYLGEEVQLLRIISQGGTTN